MWSTSRLGYAQVNFIITRKSKHLAIGSPPNTLFGLSEGTKYSIISQYEQDNILVIVHGLRDLS